ncbi:MAG: hypothetical protein JKY56_16000 [Kofleriaceae bacterium]|nr:hypothetical protein [Kofleriaceae bacterium]
MAKEENKLDTIRELAKSGSHEGTTSSSPIGGSVRGWIRVAFVENAGLKFVALVLALTVFILVHSEENEVYHPWVHITYTQEQDRVLVSKVVDQVQISVRGTRRRIQRLQKQSFESIRIDLGRLSSGELRLQPEMFNLPDGIELISINPPSIDLQFDERDVKMLPVTIDTVGLPAAGFKLGRAVSSPSEVRVTGARSVLADLDSVVTKKVNLTGRTQNFDGLVPLIRGDVQILDSSEVHVTVQIVEELQRRLLSPKAIRLISAGQDVDLERYSFSPQTVVVTMFGETHALEAIDAEKVSVYVELRAEELRLGGSRTVEIKVEPRLSDIAYTVSPSEVTMTVSAAAVVPLERPVERPVD